MRSVQHLSGSLPNIDPRVRNAIRAGVSAVNRPVAKARLQRVLRDAPRPIKLEVGGVEPRDGWIVTNVNAVTPLFLDATVRWPLEDASVSHVYADNVIEHITLDAAREMLRQTYRCLQPGGVVRLVTPDIAAYVQLYLAGTASVSSEVADFYRGMGLTVEHPVDLVRIPIGSFGHHTGYMWDFESLDAELRRAGFTTVVRCELGSSEDPVLAEYDRRATEGGVQVVVEAVR